MTNTYAFDSVTAQQYENLSSSKPSRTAIDEWQDRQRQRQRARELWELLERDHTRLVASLPPNWQSPEVDFPGLSDLEELQLKEGIPLAWVPPNDVLRRVLQATSVAVRRRIIATEADSIVAACMKELRRLRSGETKEWRRSAVEAAQVMKSGHRRAGQALAAIALDTAADTFVRSSFPDATLHLRNKKPNPPGLETRRRTHHRPVKAQRSSMERRRVEDRLAGGHNCRQVLGFFAYRGPAY